MRRRFAGSQHRNRRTPSLAALLHLSASAVFEHPWCLARPQLEQMAATYRLQENEEDDEDPECDPDDPTCPDFPVTREGLAAIPIHGTLIKSNRACFSFSFATSYSAIFRMLDSAMRRSDVRGVMLSCASPGGDSDGMLETSEFIRSCRSIKPIIAVSDSSAYSAAYSLAAAADRIFCTRTGGVGSIGTYCLHADISSQLTGNGVAITTVQSGLHKSAGSPYAPLDTYARAQLQTECDRLRLLFAENVAVSRNCSVAGLLDTEAAIYSAGDAVSVGLADGVIQDAGEALEYLDSRASSRVYPGQGPYLSTPAPRQLSAPVTAAPLRLSTMSRDQARANAFTAVQARHPGAVSASRSSRAIPSIGSGSRTINLLPVPYSDGTDLNFADLPAQGSIPACRERYRPGSFAGGLDQIDQICYFCQHRTGDDSKLLGRKSAGNLQVWEDETGVHAVVEAPDTSVGDDVLELLRAGILKSCSAGFYILRASYEQRADGYTRWIERAILNDVSLEPSPAYLTATAATTAEGWSALSALKAAELTPPPGTHSSNVENWRKLQAMKLDIPGRALNQGRLAQIPK
jgi:HK97 family phage prohead protease